MTLRHVAAGLFIVLGVAGCSTHAATPAPAPSTTQNWPAQLQQGETWHAKGADLSFTVRSVKRTAGTGDSYRELPPNLAVIATVTNLSMQPIGVDDVRTEAVAGGQTLAPDVQASLADYLPPILPGSTAHLVVGDYMPPPSGTGVRVEVSFQGQTAYVTGTYTSA